MSMHSSQTNARDTVSVEDYLAMRERAEKAEAKYDELHHWLMSTVAVASTQRSARRTIEDLVKKELAEIAKRFQT